MGRFGSFVGFFGLSFWAIFVDIFEDSFGDIFSDKKGYFDFGDKKF